MTRTDTVTQKIDREATGLNGSLFAHIEHDHGRIVAVRFSEKGKDNSTLDRILTALGDAVTAIASEIAASGGERRPLASETAMPGVVGHD